MSKYYYLISPLKAGGSKRSEFTYESMELLPPGQLVSVPFGRRISPAIVISGTQKPTFATKSIVKVLPTQVPAYLIELAHWIASYYVTPLAKVLQTVLPNQPQIQSRQSSIKIRTSQATQGLKIQLQEQQKAALKQITKSKLETFLLHGATGSGKTQIYIELTKLALQSGQSVIILVPEISLTPQIAGQFKAEFGERVILTHSGLSQAQRRLVWQDALSSKEAKIIIGPRSALFMPVPNLAYVIIDEAHETTYKQEQAPRYHARDVAAKLAQLTGAKLVLGTATPTASDLYLSLHMQLVMVAMPKPVYKNIAQPPEIIDLRDKSLLVQSRFLSEPLLEAITGTLERGKQTILFMNRRGSARLALCGNCDWVAVCPNCHIPLTLHADQGVLRCHWCGFDQPPTVKCPSCSHFDVHFLGGGTKRVEMEVNRLFPKAKTSRLDRDSFDPGTINQVYTDLQSGRTDILIGTQMITKGLDLPGVETIGIVLADSVLYLPDFTAAERTFQLLYQVRGRAGRREGTPAQTIIQTYSPKHPAIQAVASGDYLGFIDSELKERKQLGYPPYCRLLKLEVTRASRETANKTSEKLAHKLRKDYQTVEVIGPAPAWQETLRGKYTWQIICKSKRREELAKIAQNLPSNWTFDLDPINLL